jgi:hypothetical protein
MKIKEVLVAQKYFAYDPVKKEVSAYPDAQTRLNAGNGAIPFDNETQLNESPLTLPQLVELHNALAPNAQVGGFGDRAAAVKLTFALAEKTKVGASTDMGNGKKPKAPKAEGESKPKGRAKGTGTFNGHKLRAVPKENPRRPDSNGFKSFQIVLDNPGITYEAFIEKGGQPQNLRKDVSLGRIVTNKPA